MTPSRPFAHFFKVPNGGRVAAAASFHQDSSLGCYAGATT
jgi:hypothetical protein